MEKTIVTHHGDNYALNILSGSPTLTFHPISYSFSVDYFQ